jgi:hypothetical protein
VSAELANNAYAYLLIALTDVINTVTKACVHLLITLTNATKADLFMYSITVKSRYISTMFIRIMVNTGVSKKSITSYKQF